MEAFVTFFAQNGLILVLGALLIFMFWSSRRRMQKQKAEQEAKARQTVPGAEVLMQGGLYGTIVAYDPDNLDQPAVVEIAPGVEIKVHSQAILRVIEPSTDVATEDDFIVGDEHEGEISAAAEESEEKKADAAADSDSDAGTDTKPQA